MGINFDGGPSKLKGGSGEGVVYMLYAMAEKAVSLTGFKFKRPTHKVEEFSEEAEVDQDAELTTDGDEVEIDERINGGYGGGDDTEMFIGGGAGKEDTTKEMIVLKPKIDPSEWKLEVERVTPLLRVQISNDNKDWRIHLEQIKHHHATIIKLTKSTQDNLSILHKEIDSTLEKIVSREKYINTQFEAQTQEFRSLQESDSEYRQKHSQANLNVTGLTNELSHISEDLESVKTRMDDIGTGMTDSKPLVNLKQGYSRLKNELKQLDLRTGVVRHSLLAAQMRDKNSAGLKSPNSPMFAIHA